MAERLRLLLYVQRQTNQNHYYGYFYERMTGILRNFDEEDESFIMFLSVAAGPYIKNHLTLTTLSVENLR